MSAHRARHPELHTAAPYVLGALRGAERERFVDHLATCEECRAEVGRLAVLPELLALVPADVAAALADGSSTPEVPTQPAPDPRPASDVTPSSAGGPAPWTRSRTGAPADDVPASVLDALLRAAREEERLEERRARRRRAVVTVLAAAALVVGGVAIGQLVDPPWARDGVPQAAPSAEPDARTVTLDAVGDPVPVTATARLEDVAWGTRVELSCTYDGDAYATPAEYALVLRDAAGREERVATWTAVPGRTVTVPAATSWRAADVVAVEMVRPDGTAVLRWEA